ncbi:TetR family transcriptional regulator [Nocardia sp. NPDC005366]|uniref:TetR/AcrR family transcriptional regulator n=1 Tax=Nocardia sp. NPDC005366 TaxID=3156878 RepID=UPI0033A7C5AE
MSTTDRRVRIVDAAIDLIATRGLRALTHRALDTALELPPGSASYYFRTKRALVEAIADRITTRSREDFLAAGLLDAIVHIDADGDTHLDPDTIAHAIAHAIARWLDHLLTERRNHLVARHALIVDLLGEPDPHDRLARGLFSVERARDLFLSMGSPDPDRTAADFVAVVEGAVFDRFAGLRAQTRPGTAESVSQLTALLAAFLHGVAYLARPNRAAEACTPDRAVRSHPAKGSHRPGSPQPSTE